MEGVAGIMYVMVSLDEKEGLQISQPDHSLLQHCQVVVTSTPSFEESCCSPAALLLAQHSTGPSTTWTGRGPSSLLSTPAFCLLSNGMSHAPGRLGLHFRI